MPENLQYPRNRENNDYAGTITFRPFSEPIQDIQGLYEGLTGALNSLLNGDSDGFTPQDVDAHRGNNQIPLSGSTSVKEFTGDKCTLYLPGALQIADGAVYDNFDLGVIGASAEQAIRNNQSIAGAVFSSSSEGIRSIIDTFTSGTRGSDAARLAVTRGAEAVLPDKIAGAVRSVTKVTVNPNTKALFKSVPLREFSFSFRLIATSRSEAEEIKQIIKFFRTELYPDIIPLGDTGVSAGYKFPNKFEIAFKYKNQPIGIKILPCYLRNINTVYNSNGMGFHSDGNFTEVDVSMQFVESTTLNKSLVKDEGY